MICALRLFLRKEGLFDLGSETRESDREIWGEISGVSDLCVLMEMVRAGAHNHLPIHPYPKVYKQLHKQQ